LRTRENGIFIGVGVVVCVGVLAVMVTARWDMERERLLAEAAVARGAPPGSRASPVLQLPKIRAHSERNGIVVILSNDTSNRLVLIDPDKDRIVVEYESVLAGPLIREVSLDARTLACGEATEPVFIPLEGRWESAEVRLEHRDRELLVTTSVTIPCVQDHGPFRDRDLSQHDAEARTEVLASIGFSDEQRKIFAAPPPRKLFRSRGIGRRIVTARVSGLRVAVVHEMSTLCKEAIKEIGAPKIAERFHLDYSPQGWECADYQVNANRRLIRYLRGVGAEEPPHLADWINRMGDPEIRDRPFWEREWQSALWAATPLVMPWLFEPEERLPIHIFGSFFHACSTSDPDWASDRAAELCLHEIVHAAIVIDGIGLRGGDREPESAGTLAFGLGPGRLHSALSHLSERVAATYSVRMGGSDGSYRSVLARLHREWPQLDGAANFLLERAGLAR
jgi:hypothetical protein